MAQIQSEINGDGHFSQGWDGILFFKLQQLIKTFIDDKSYLINNQIILHFYTFNVNIDLCYVPI